MRQHLVLGHRVERDPRLRALRSAAPIVVVVGAVHQEQVGRGRLAVGVELTAFERPGIEARREPGHELHQAQLVAPLTRQAVDLRVRDVRADPARRHFDQRRFAGHRDGFCEPGHCERQVQRQLLPDAEDDAGLRHGLEALKLGLDGVRARDQRRRSRTARHRS